MGRPAPRYDTNTGEYQYKDVKGTDETKTDVESKGEKRELVDAPRQGEVDDVQVDGDGEADVADNGRDGEGMDDFRGGGRGKYANVDGEVPLAMKTDRTGRGCLKRNTDRVVDDAAVDDVRVAVAADVDCWNAQVPKGAQRTKIFLLTTRLLEAGEGAMMILTLKYH